MAVQPKPLQTWAIGNAGARITMGLYAYTERDDDNPRKILARGFVFCPVVGAENAMQGLYDPEQPLRLDYSKDREPGGGVAVLAGSEKPDDLTELKRDTARAFLEAVQDKLTGRLSEKYADKNVDLLRQHPKNILDTTAWDEQTSTSLYTQYPVANRTEILPGFLSIVQKAAEKSVAELPPPSTAGAALVAAAPLPEAPPKKWAATAAATESQEAVAPVIPPQEQARILGELTTSLMRRFPGNEHATARTEVFQDMRAILKGQRNAGDNPH